ncbi:MAG: hypothetical protein K2O99_01345, partial [Lachnospiraceae bacterium]|nr:hypothetical protein [Lachnospiraceae bacterium]
IVLLKHKGLNRYKVIGMIICILPTAFTVRWTGNYIVNSSECVQRQSIFENTENWMQNAKYFFRDYKKADVIARDINGFMVFDTNGSMMSMTDLDVPIINVKSGALTEAGKKQCEFLLSDIEANGKIYSISKPNALVQLIDEIKSQNYSIESLRTITMPTMVNTNQYCYLVSVENEKKEIRIYDGNEISELVFDSSLAGKKLNIWIGRKWRDMSDEAIALKICTDTDEETIDISLDADGEFYRYEKQLTDTIDKEVRVAIDAVYLLNKWLIVEY